MMFRRKKQMKRGEEKYALYNDSGWKKSNL